MEYMNKSYIHNIVYKGTQIPKNVRVVIYGDSTLKWFDENIHRSDLVEMCFTEDILKTKETFFWNVVKSFASLMTSSQVLSIRVIYGIEVEE